MEANNMSYFKKRCLLFGFLFLIGQGSSKRSEILEEFNTEDDLKKTKRNLSDRQLVIAYFPYKNPYYSGKTGDIAQFILSMSHKTEGYDNFLILYHDKTGIERIKSFHGDFGTGTRCLQASNLGLWARDYSPLLAKHQIKFKYWPNYIDDKSLPEGIDTALKNLFHDHHIMVNEHELILDGGNAVDNGDDKVIITERVISDNKGNRVWYKARESIINKLESVMGVNVSIIPDYGDTTGHADGLVSFIDKNTLLVCDYQNNDEWLILKNRILQKFPNLVIKKLHCYHSESRPWKDIPSAVGVYVNMLVTNNAIYVPQFSNEVRDEIAMREVSQYTNKKVIGINTASVGDLGGNVRCLTWQVDGNHEVARQLLADSHPC